MEDDSWGRLRQGGTDGRWKTAGGEWNDCRIEKGPACPSYPFHIYFRRGAVSVGFHRRLKVPGP